MGEGPRLPHAPRRTSRRMVLAATLAVFDVFAIYEAFVLAFNIRASEPAALRQPMTISDSPNSSPLLSPAWVLIFAAVGLYGRRTPPRLRQ